MKHLDLFAGIGGFSLAAQWCGWETVAFVEWDKFCQKVLRKNFGDDIEIYDDIRDFDGNKYSGQIDIITGGFPCQPFSQAGKQKGKGDDRYLFPEMLRVIKEVRPKWIVAENVRGLLSIQNGEVFSEICSQLESQDYNVWTFGVPASAVEAPHERMRLWIVAQNATSVGRSEGWTESAGQFRSSAFIHANSSVGNPSSERLQITGLTGLRELQTQGREGLDDRPQLTDRDASDSESSERSGEWRETRKRRDQSGCGDSRDSNASYSSLGGSQGSRELGRSVHTASSGDREVDRAFNEGQFKENWLEAATRLCRVDDGVSAELDELRGFRDNRVNRLKALGNSIVPQIAYEIFRSIEAAE